MWKFFSECLDLLSNRQKLIRLADSSDLGWSVVKEYQNNPLASDSKDEKRMFRAEARANRKLKQRRFDRSRRMQRFQPYQSSATPTTPTGQLQGSALFQPLVSTDQEEGENPVFVLAVVKLGIGSTNV